MKNLLNILFALSTLAGCISTGVMVDLDKVAQFQKGVTTEADVISQLGQPTSVSTYGDIKTLAYSGTEAHPTGLISSKAKSTFVMLQFQNGKLLNVTTSQSNTKTN